MFLGSTLIIFVMMRLLPGDVVDQLMGLEGSLSAEARASLRQVLGLDAPMPLQYLRWLGDLVRLDLGVSLRSSLPVREMLLQRLPVTIELAVLSVVLSLAIAVPLGIVSALYRNRAIDLLPRPTAPLVLSTTVVWVAADLTL